MIWFEVKGGVESGKKLMNTLELWSLAENLGSVESLVTHSVTMTHADMDPAERQRVGITDGLVRLSVGLENVEDLTPTFAKHSTACRLTRRGTAMSTFLENIPIADAHHHLWDLSHGIYPWLGDRPNESFFLGDYAAIRRNYLPHDYRADASSHNVAWTVHVEAEWDRTQQVRETEWLSSVADEHGMPHVLVAHAWFDDPSIEAVLEAHCQHPLVRGIRSKPARPGQDPHDVDEARGACRTRRGGAGLRFFASTTYGGTSECRFGNFLKRRSCAGRSTTPRSCSTTPAFPGTVRRKVWRSGAIACALSRLAPMYT